LHRTLVFRPRVTQYVFIELIQSRGLRPCRGLCIRPIRHQLEHRADAHTLIAFLAYCLHAEAAPVAARLRVHAYGGVGEVGGNQND
jgi:hypothetical protein